MRLITIILMASSIMLLTACAGKSYAVKTETPKNTNNGIVSVIAKVPSDKQERLSELLSFIESYSNLTLDAQKKVFAVTNLGLAENKNNLVLRIKQAIMLSIPTSRLRDTTKAQALLQDLLRDSGLDTEESALLGLLYEYTQDDIKQLQKIRDEAKKQDTTQQKYEALLQKHEALEQKLNELKNIEKTINDRSKQ